MPWRNFDEDLPPHNPDTPPDSHDPAGPCPRCGRISNFSIEGSLPVTFAAGGYAITAEGRHERIDSQRASVLECSGCRARIVAIEDKYVGNERADSVGGFRSGGTINYRGIWWWPPSGVADLDASVPDEIADAYRASARCGLRLRAREP